MHEDITHAAHRPRGMLPMLLVSACWCLPEAGASLTQGRGGGVGAVLCVVRRRGVLLALHAPCHHCSYLCSYKRRLHGRRGLAWGTVDPLGGPSPPVRPPPCLQQPSLPAATDLSLQYAILLNTVGVMASNGAVQAQSRHVAQHGRHDARGGGRHDRAAQGLLRHAALRARPPGAPHERRVRSHLLLLHHGHLLRKHGGHAQAAAAHEVRREERAAGRVAHPVQNLVPAEDAGHTRPLLVFECSALPTASQGDRAGTCPH